ncbi:hypothetical protein L873DRAFT_1067166 [Choiromyces venosus 120613-1]|uniref:Uncharacterized protein n=1 Tax=Choiromyces venosus 120613-1 TaxID=1336337 RepID=A0A3N4JNQ0_9PEZI|nr:hypothetical protein L873DRAFT_1067166 [Choiromyces venosus 120613-1]
MTPLCSARQMDIFKHRYFYSGIITNHLFRQTELMSASRDGRKRSRLGNSQSWPFTHFNSRPNRMLMWRFVEPRRIEL